MVDRTACRMQVLRWMGVVAVVLLAALEGVGCAVTSAQRQSLDTYVKAMAAVEQSADLFLTDVANTDRVAEDMRRTAGLSSPALAAEYPTQYTPPTDDLTDGATPGLRAVAASRRALAAVHDYDAALIALAEGRGEQEVKANLTTFGSTLQSIATVAGQAIPGLGALTDFGPKLVKLAQDAANREQLIRAVQAGREPVAIILDVLEKQTPSMYRLSVISTSQAQQALMEQMARSGFALKTLLGRHGAPSDAAAASAVVAAQADVADIARSTRTRLAMPLPFAFSAGRPPFDAGALAETQVFLQSMRISAQRYAELVAKQNAYHALLDAYVRALRETRRSLDALQRSLAAPVDPLEQAQRLFEAAFELRTALAAYRHPPPTP